MGVGVGGSGVSPGLGVGVGSGVGVGVGTGVGVNVGVGCKNGRSNGSADRSIGSPAQPDNANATTNTVVLSSLAILALDFVLTAVML